jgi:hypothetical protein
MMRQADLDHAVARATGESMDTIRRLGFRLDDSVIEIEESAAFGSGVCDALINWDMFEAERFAESNGNPASEPVTL